MPTPKSSRPFALIIAAVIAFTTVAVVANATTTLTVPNAATLTYNLAAGSVSGAIVPATSRPVLVMGTCTTVGFRGVGQVTLLIPSAAPQFVEWVGLESPAPAGITSGFSGAAGAHIVFLDFAHQVELEVRTVNTIRVANAAGAARTGIVTLIW